MIKHGSAVWRGDISAGGGTISTETGVLKEAPYGFKSRFEEGPGTNPEELLGAAHAGCFSMAFALMLCKAGFPPLKIETQAAISLEKVEGNFAITASHLSVVADVPGLDRAKFLDMANQAKSECPVSKLFRARITMDAVLQS
jgi:osmotically inducible protein OsmC